MSRPGEVALTMEAVSLKSRAVVFALCAGAVAFVLALLATSHGVVDGASVSSALIPAIVCGAMCWASTERALSQTAGAIDAAIERMARAAQGDLVGELPPEIARDVPQLAAAMDGLFRQLGTNLDNINRLALFDSVTGLPNRTHFRHLSDQVIEALPHGGGAALFFIDLDRFKSVNDTYGHASGDMLLGMVAGRLSAVAERLAAEHALGAPIVGRFAGDEFTILMSDIVSADQTARIGRAILFALSEPFDLAGRSVDIGASIGIAQHPQHGHGLSDLIRAADLAMYDAKARGRGRAEPFTDTLAAAAAERARLDSQLHAAIAGDEFTLAFQPQVAVSDGTIVAVEALLRWRHPDDGMRLPASFLPRAEETGMMVEIGDWVVAAVADTLVRWGRIGIAHRLALNVSARELDHAGFFRRLRAAMHAAGAPPRLLELEISESLAMRCSREVLDALAALRLDGATVAIDDFGTGYSNLPRLRELPVDRIKLDRSLIEHVTDRAEARTIAHAVISLVHGLGCEAVAEGIESDAQANVLRVIGCDVLQGYAVAPPMDEATLIAWSRNQDRRLVG
jgi:diguanylate cyclase (GGDEF)-like protein